MTAPDLVDRLAAHRALGRAPREELAWLASHGSLRQLNTGDTLTSAGRSVEGLFVVLAGRIAIFVDRGAGLNKIMGVNADHSGPREAPRGSGGRNAEMILSFRYSSSR